MRGHLSKVLFSYRDARPYTRKITYRSCYNRKLTHVYFSDTTGPSLILLWFFLAGHPEDTKKIYKELTSINPHDISALAALPHLNGGVINESMRLLPAALTMGTRVTPPEGLYVDGCYIPGDTKIAAPRYSIFRR